MFDWLAYLSYAITIMYSPGPNNIIAMSNGIAVGAKKGIKFNFGVFTGFFILMFITTFFLNKLNILIKNFNIFMQILGSIYLFYLAIKMCLRNININQNKNENVATYLDGIILQFVNVKAHIARIMISQMYIIPVYKGNIFMMTVLIIITALLSFLSTVLWLIFGNAFREFFNKYYKAVNIIMAILLLFCIIKIWI